MQGLFHVEEGCGSEIGEVAAALEAFWGDAPLQLFAVGATRFCSGVCASPHLQHTTYTALFHKQAHPL